jgi:hypothetical protein
MPGGFVRTVGRIDQSGGDSPGVEANPVPVGLFLIWWLRQAQLFEHLGQQGPRLRNSDRERPANCRSAELS